MKQHKVKLYYCSLSYNSICRKHKECSCGCWNDRIKIRNNCEKNTVKADKYYGITKSIIKILEVIL